jgi:malate dehydrogenase (oxaloacetate-decarboxylating)
MSNSVVHGIPNPLSTPTISQGTARQRHALGLTGRLPSAVLTLDRQATRLSEQLCTLPDDLTGNLLLEQMHNRYEVLYYKVLSEHRTELLPVVDDPTVGDAIERYSDEHPERQCRYEAHPVYDSRSCGHSGHRRA